MFKAKQECIYFKDVNVYFLKPTLKAWRKHCERVWNSFNYKLDEIVTEDAVQCSRLIMVGDENTINNVVKSIKSFIEKSSILNIGGITFENDDYYEKS